MALDGNGGGAGNGAGDGRMRHAAEKAVASVWMTLAARASAIMAAPLFGLLGGLLGYIYITDQAQAEKERSENKTAIHHNARLIYRTSVNLAGVTNKLEALDKNDGRQDAEILRLRDALERPGERPGRPHGVGPMRRNGRWEDGR
jgi:hypothetical protein